MTAPAMLVVNCPKRVVALVAAQLEATQGDYDRYVLSPETVTAIGMIAESEAVVTRELEAGRLAEASRHFREDFPALVRWRDRLLKSPRRAAPQEIAAAYELVALECLLAGEHRLANAARARAARAVGVRSNEAAGV